MNDDTAKQRGEFEELLRQILSSQIFGASVEHGNIPFVTKSMLQCTNIVMFELNAPFEKQRVLPACKRTCLCHGFFATKNRTFLFREEFAQKVLSDGKATANRTQARHLCQGGGNLTQHCVP